MKRKILVGIIAGIVSGMFASGGGLILVPAYVSILGLSEKEARASSVFSIIPMVLVTAVFYYNNSFFDWRLGALCAIGGVIGGILGAKVLKIIPDKWLKITFIVFLIYSGVYMIIKS